MFSGVIDFSDVIYSFAIGSVGAGPYTEVSGAVRIECRDHAQTAAIRAWAVLAGVSADASRVSHGPTPHHLREQERRERPFGLSTGDTGLSN